LPDAQSIGSAQIQTIEGTGYEIGEGTGTDQTKKKTEEREKIEDER
jgi:hypothetical protein